MDDETRRSKEQFVSNLNGTTWEEIDSIQLMQPLCVIMLASFSCFVYHGREHKSRVNLPNAVSEILDYVVDFVFCVLPLLALLTIFSDYMAAVFQFSIVFVILILVVTCTNFNRVPFDVIWNANTGLLHSKYISWYRAYVNVLTAICILAVDFKIYPRRLAKTETYGTGLMDIFVGAFVMGNSLVCKEATDPKMELRNIKGKLASMVRVLKSSLPLTLLGIARLVTTKSSNYQEHVTEYGVHWNFFVTLAATRVFCTMMLCLVKPSKAFLLGGSFAVVYQYLLCNKLEEYILRPGGRTESFVSANREGIFSMFGYMALYFAGVTVGQLIFQSRRSTLGQNVKLCAMLLLISGLSLAAQMWAEIYGIRVSRRLANLPFVLWTIHHSVLVIAGMLSISLIHHVLDLLFTVSIGKRPISILEAVNYNGLLYFLLANILTGLVNMSMNTLERTTGESIAILICYLFTLNTIISIMYKLKICTKFW